MNKINPKKISLDELKIIANEQRFNLILIEKDYLLTCLLYLIRDVKNIYFKGGTALNKIIFNHERLSEDLDFTLNGNINKVETEIKSRLKGTIFKKITHDKRVDHFVRLIVHYRLFHEKGTIFIDLNEKGKIILKPQKLPINHFYSKYLPEFQINCLHKDEIIAEKIMAACNRYKPRDYLDLYFIINSEIPISINLIKKLFKKRKLKFQKELLFKKTNKVFRNWESDLFGLTKSTPSFTKVMKTIQSYFKYKNY